jgi:outer membrane protein TolC
MAPRAPHWRRNPQQAKDRLVEVRAALLPNLDTSVRENRQTTNLKAYGFAFNIPIPGFSIPALVGPFDVFDARATAQQSVLNFSTVRKYQASKATLAATKFDNDATRSQVSDEVARAYLACLRADADRDTARANVELSEAPAGTSPPRADRGHGYRHRSHSRRSAARQRSPATDSRRKRPHACDVAASKVHGTASDASIEFTDKLVYKPVDPASSETLLEQARGARFELKTQQQREEAARLSNNAVKSERLPSIGASADYSAIGTDVVSSRATYTLGVSLRSSGV